MFSTSYVSITTMGSGKDYLNVSRLLSIRLYTTSLVCAFVSTQSLGLETKINVAPLLAGILTRAQSLRLPYHIIEGQIRHYGCGSWAFSPCVVAGSRSFTAHSS